MRVGSMRARVVFTYDAVLRTDYQAGLCKPRIGEGAEDVIEERPPDRNHCFKADSSRRGLRLVQLGIGVAFAHSSAEPTRENHALADGDKVAHGAQTSLMQAN